MKWKLKLATILFLTLAIFVSGASAATKYVKEGATNGNGDSWATAYNATGLASFLNGTPGTVEIWVAAGTYSPGSTVNSSFDLKKGVTLLGGFAGTETAIAQRDWVKNPTKLNGGGAIYHVVSSRGVAGGAQPTPTDTRLDGFIITGGKANVSGNYYGGGMYNSNSSPVITNCTFSDNSATDGNGGGMYNYTNSSPVITNCTFSGNSATSGGGMANISSSSPTVANTIFWGNTATSGPAIYHAKPSSATDTLTLSNDVITPSGVVVGGNGSGTVTINSSDIITDDPKLVPFKDGHYLLYKGSSAIGKGLAVGTIVSGDVEVPATNQRGKARATSPASTDIGAIEGDYQNPPTPPTPTPPTPTPPTPASNGCTAVPGMAFAFVLVVPLLMVRKKK